MPTGEFEKKIHRWASLICCFGEQQMPGRGRKHLQLAGYEFADAYPGVGSICNLLDLDLQMPGRDRKYLQFASIGFVDTYRGEFRMWKYLQFASIGFVDAWSGLEASTTC